MDALLRRRLMMLGGGGPTPPPTPQPVFYQRLRFDGTAFIEMPSFSLPENGSIYFQGLGWETTQSTCCIFDSVELNAGRIAMTHGGATSTSAGRQFLVYYDSSSYLNPINIYLPYSYNSYSFWLGPKHWGWGNQGHNITKGNLSHAQGLKLGRNRGSTAGYTGATREVMIYPSSAQDVNNAATFANYTPVEIFRPCLYNGEAGMWQVSNETFHGNSAASGSLSVEGNIVTP